MVAEGVGPAAVESCILTDNTFHIVLTCGEGISFTDQSSNSFLIHRSLIIKKSVLSVFWYCWLIQCNKRYISLSDQTEDKSLCFTILSSLISTGVCEGPFDTVFDWVWRKTNQQGEPVIRFNTYFFRKGWYWLYENRNNRSRSRDPRGLRSGWQGIPVESIDAFIHVWTRYCNAAYFFKGTHTKIYINIF